MTKTTLLLFVIFIVSCAPRVPQDATVIDEYPPIFPDYADSIVVPPNIAPLNFILPDSMVDAVVVIAARHCGLDLDPKTNIVIKGNDIRIPIKKWRKFCIPTIAPNTTSNEQQPQAEQSTITITVYHNNKQYKPLHWLVSKDSIDPYIVYRLVLPTDGVYQTISLNERTLSDFNTRPILQNTATKNSCFNCHSFQNYNGDKMILQLRNPRGLFIKDENGARTIIPPSINNTTDENVAQSGLLYSTWHPTQNLVVFSAGSRIPVCFYMPSNERYYYNQSEVNSRLIVYHNGEWKTITHDTAEYSYPTWHPDGQTLFFVRSIKKPATPYPDSPEWLSEYSFDICYMHYDTATELFKDTVYTLAKAEDFAKNLALEQTENLARKTAATAMVAATATVATTTAATVAARTTAAKATTAKATAKATTATFSSNGIYGKTPPSGGSFGAPRVSPDGTFLVATYSRHAGNPIRSYGVLVGVPLRSLQCENTPLRCENVKNVESTSLRRESMSLWCESMPFILSEITDSLGRGDSWASFSSNGKWLMFASKRIDGYYTQVYFSHVDSGTERRIFSRPFPLPQRSGNIYKQSPKAFNLPEFTLSPFFCCAERL